MAKVKQAMMLLLDLYKEWRKGDASRSLFASGQEKIPGIYVPSLYEVSYKKMER